MSDRTAPLDLWRIAERFLHRFWSIFGDPQDVARQHTHNANERRDLLHWLRAGEAVLRHLLLIEASALHLPPLRQRARPPRPRARRFVECWPDKPEAWPARFRCFPSSPARGGSVRACSAMTNGDAPHVKGLHSAWPLAERYEAMLRVFNTPGPYAQRLARRLRAAPQCVRSLAAYPPQTPHIADEDHFAALRAAFAPARAAFDTS